MLGTKLLILFFIAFLPPIIYSIWIRNTEKYHREKWFPIIFCFIWGATIAIVASILLEVFLGNIVFSYSNSSNMGLLLAVFIAPFAEELTKPLALRYRFVRRELNELEDGLIYGAVAGLGFSATENLFYGYEAFISSGFWYFLVLMILRSFGGCLLHASATAWTGYGFGKKIIRNKSLIRVIPYFAFAILLHSTYNGLLSIDISIPFIGTGYSSLIGLILAFILAGLTIFFVRRRIIFLDKKS
jgi:RsiW-degrading membrane proteinase PrsW (M82 family)